MTGRRTLAVDVGGTGIKAAVYDAAGTAVGDPIRVDTAYPCPPARLLEQVRDIATACAPADRCSVGFPGLLRSDRVVWVNSLTRSIPGSAVDPVLAEQWVGFPLKEALTATLGVATMVANDADLHALASVSGRGLECVLTLGTGLGFSLVNDGTLLPHLELGGAPFLDGRDFEGVLGDAGRDRDGTPRWIGHVEEAVEALRRFLYFDHLYIGGGNARLLAAEVFGADVTLVDNINGLRGGYLIWTMG